MSYFSYFPLTSVIMNEQDVKIVQARNIMLRAKFSDFIKNRKVFLKNIKSEREKDPILLRINFTEGLSCIGSF